MESPVVTSVRAVAYLIADSNTPDVLPFVLWLSKPSPRITTLSTAEVKVAGFAAFVVIPKSVAAASTKVTRVASEYCVVNSPAVDANVAAVQVACSVTLLVHGAKHQVVYCVAPCKTQSNMCLIPSTVAKL